ncbi:N-acetylmuramoyl-L-alanine amidase [Listeria monocytogenes]|nr:N-acetylmuramoyl-L-alanine amidase [Listeria monocytogenes]EBF5108483.1 N-acetylmuramoyl-L-alanine amidase [Listeria monocytogenes]
MSKIAAFAGHNGTYEQGANGNGLTEKGVTKEAAQIATSYAESCGHEVINGFGKSLSERIKYANSENVAAVLEFHANSGGGQGAETLFCAGISSAQQDAVVVAKAGAIKGLKNRGAKGDTTTRHGRLGIVRDTKAPALLHELFFIDSASDVAIWKNNKKAIVESITKAWLESQGLNAVPKGSTSAAAKNPNRHSGAVVDSVPMLPKMDFKSSPVKMYKAGSSLLVYECNKYWYKAYINDKLCYIYKDFCVSNGKKDVKGRIPVKIKSKDALRIPVWDNTRLNSGKIKWYKPGTKLSWYDNGKGFLELWYTKDGWYYTANYFLK